MAKRICDACHREQDHVQVGASMMVPFSFAYCPECLEHSAEPLDVMDAVADDLGGVEHLAKWARRTEVFDRAKQRYVAYEDYVNDRT